MGDQNRRPKGISTGGQFAAKTHSEPVGIVLSVPQPTSTDRVCDAIRDRFPDAGYASLAVRPDGPKLDAVLSHDGALIGWDDGEATYAALVDEQGLRPALDEIVAAEGLEVGKLYDVNLSTGEWTWVEGASA